MTWLIDKTVSPTNHGRPRKEQTIISMAIMNKSKWYPFPFWCGKKMIMQ